jgi:hypothetical protein
MSGFPHHSRIAGQVMATFQRRPDRAPKIAGNAVCLGCFKYFDSHFRDLNTFEEINNISLEVPRFVFGGFQGCRLGFCVEI